MEARRKEMRRALLVTIFVVGGATLCLFMQSGRAGIVGSAHDFSSMGWSGGEICKPCHAPHNAAMPSNEFRAPLWNHAVTNATFTVYSSATTNATIGQPTSGSKLCLSCHDGTVALDSFGGATGSVMISGNKNLGTNLSNDHPISFTYDTALSLADGELYDPATTPGVNTLLRGGKVQCSSCHDAHNTPNQPKLLQKSNAASALCLTCHKK